MSILRFAFDNVFDEIRDNDWVYKKSAATLVRKIFEGYNATVFAYGATGVGKTHTMVGETEEPGLMFLVFQDVFAQQKRFKDSQFEFKISFVEIYNEEVRDLLADKSPDLDLREDPNRGTIVHGVSYHEVEDSDEVMELLLDGNLRRKTDPTRANATSSRSHAILQIWVDRTEKGSIQHLRCGKFNLCDLAGSEKPSDSGSSRKRRREGANINRSLLSLSNCINALVDKRKFIPYRDSKLTRLLKDSLGESSFTIMLACLSPSNNFWDDTNATLKYADRAKNIKLDSSVNRKLAKLTAKDYARIIAELKNEVNTLKEKLEDRVGDVSDVQKIGFGLTAKEREELLALRERTKQLYTECHQAMEQMFAIEETLLEQKIKKDAFDAIVEKTRDDEIEIEVLESKMASNREKRLKLKNAITNIKRKFDPNGAEWEVRSKTVFVLIERELEIALTTLSCAEYEFDNKKMVRTNDEIQRRVEILESELSARDEENKGSVAETIQISKEVEDIRAANVELQRKNLAAEDVIRQAHAAHDDSSFWGAFGATPTMTPQSPAMIAVSVQVPDKSLWERWDLDEVQRWLLADEKLRNYAPQFAENDICGEDLIDITEEDLINMGMIPLGHRKHFIRAVNRLAGKQPTKYSMENLDALTDASMSDGASTRHSIQSGRNSLTPRGGANSEREIAGDDADERNPKTALEYIAMYEPARLNKLTREVFKGEPSDDVSSALSDPDKKSYIRLVDNQNHLNFDDMGETPHVPEPNVYTTSEAPSKDFDTEPERPLVSLDEKSDTGMGVLSESEGGHSDQLETLVDYSDDDLSIWTPRQVYSWLLTENIQASYARSFLDHKVDGKRLIDVVRSDLKAMGIKQHGQRNHIYNLIQRLKHRKGIHEKFTEEIPDFPEVIENFNFLVLGPIKEIKDQHMRLWIPGYNKVQGNRVKWHMEVYPYGNNATLGVRIGDLTSLSLLPDLLSKVSFIVLLFRFNQETDLQEYKYINELKEVLSTDDVRTEFWKKTVVGLDGGLSFIPDLPPGNAHGLTQSLEHWQEFTLWRVNEISKLLTPWGCPPNVIHVIEQDTKGMYSWPTTQQRNQDTKGMYSEDMENNEERPFRWPTIPDPNLPRSQDWRTSFLLRVVKFQEIQSIKRLIVACALNSPYILPKELEALANKALEKKNQQSGPATRDDSSRIQRIQVLRERLDMLVSQATDDGAEREVEPPVPAKVVSDTSPHVHFSVAPQKTPDIHPTLLGRPVFAGDPPAVALGGVVAGSDYAPTLDLSDDEEPIQGNAMEAALRQLDYQSQFQPNHNMLRLKQTLDEEARKQSQKENSIITKFREVARTKARDDASSVSSGFTAPSIIRKLHEVAGETYNVSESNDTRVVSQLNQRPHETFSGGLNHKQAASTLRNLGHNAPSAGSSTTGSYRTDSTNVISLRGGRKYRSTIHVDDDDEKMDELEQKRRKVHFDGAEKDDAISVLTVPTAPISTVSGEITNVVGATHREVITEYIRRLTLIYRKFEPKMIAYIPTMLKHNVGKEHEMYTKVCLMYKLPVQTEWVIVDKPQKTPSSLSSNHSPSSSASPVRQMLPTFRNRGRASPSPGPSLQKSTQFIQTTRPTNKGGLILQNRKIKPSFR